MLAGKKTYLPVASLSCDGLGMEMIVTANQKGGVGKSTLAVHLAVWLFDRGTTVALLDADKQRSSSQWMVEAEPNVTIRTVDSPENCVSVAQDLAQSHDFVVGDGPGGLDDLSRTLLILADLAVIPISPSILDVRSVSQATEVLRYAQGINRGRPEARLVLNKMRTRGDYQPRPASCRPQAGASGGKPCTPRSRGVSRRGSARDRCHANGQEGDARRGRDRGAVCGTYWQARRAMVTGQEANGRKWLKDDRCMTRWR